MGAGRAEVSRASLSGKTLNMELRGAWRLPVVVMKRPDVSLTRQSGSMPSARH
jgi:hypothetical protein